MKNNNTNTANPDKIGIGKFWAWQSRGASAAINFIVVSFVAIYCTDALGMPPALVGTLLAVSTVINGSIVQLPCSKDGERSAPSVSEKNGTRASLSRHGCNQNRAGH